MGILSSTSRQALLSCGHSQVSQLNIFTSCLIGSWRLSRFQETPVEGANRGLVHSHLNAATTAQRQVLLSATSLPDTALHFLSWELPELGAHHLCYPSRPGLSQPHTSWVGVGEGNIRTGTSQTGAP